MKNNYLSYRQRFLWLTVFAVAMGFLEAIVVIYLRELYYPEGFSFPLKLMSPDLVTIEWIREIATLVMLAGVGVIAGRNNLQRLWYALFAFGVWDIFYYVALRLLIGWPASLLTWDLLFLIPVSWLGPVVAPVLNSVTMIIMALMLVAREENGYCVKVRLTDWILIFGGALIILYTYLIDYTRLIIQSGVFAPGGSQEAAEQLATLITGYAPDNYRWLMFVMGELLIVAATVNIYFRSARLQKNSKLS